MEKETEATRPDEIVVPFVEKEITKTPTMGPRDLWSEPGKKRRKKKIMNRAKKLFWIFDNLRTLSL